MPRLALMLVALLLSATAEAGPPRARLRFSAEGPWLRPVHDGYEWQGKHWNVHIGRDGVVRWQALGATAATLAVIGVEEERRWFLDETEEMRVDLGGEERERLQRMSLDGLPDLLGRLWSDSRWTVEERRHLLFAIWDEAAEPSDAELGAVGKKARALIEIFVSRNLPAGSPAGFSADELAQLNARRPPDEPRFDPYGATHQVDHSR